MYDKFVASIYEVQQKSGMKNLLLEKKLETVKQDLETKELTLTKVISAANLDPSTAQNMKQKVEDLVTEKNGTIKDLQYEVARVKKAYNEAVRVYESKMKEFGVPVEELGFKPNIMDEPGGTTTPANFVVY